MPLDCPAERCARSSCRVERREHDDHPNACGCFIDKDQAHQIQAWKREAYERRQLEIPRSCSPDHRNVDRDTSKVVGSVSDPCRCGHSSYNHREQDPGWCFMCDCMFFDQVPTGEVVRMSNGATPSYVIVRERSEPRKQIWLPGLATHLWIATVVMLIVGLTHPWQWDQAAASMVLLNLAVVFSAKQGLDT